MTITHGTAWAVSPLTVDDGDPVEFGRLQVNSGWQFSRGGGIASHSLLLNPVVGIHSRGELGVTLGGQWRDGFGVVPGQRHDSDLTDLTVASKWRLWESTDQDFKLSIRPEVKIPIASTRKGFGTGSWDIGGVLIATRCWEYTCLDWNFGYTAADVSDGAASNDQWFAGQAIRHELNARWTLIGEIYAIVPQRTNASSAHVHFNAGAQVSLRENLLLSALAGTAMGADSPDLTCYLGLTVVF